MNYFLELMVKYFRVKVNMAVDKCVIISLQEGRNDLVNALKDSLLFTLPSGPSNWHLGALAFLLLSLQRTHLRLG